MRLSIFNARVLCEAIAVWSAEHVPKLVGVNVPNNPSEIMECDIYNGEVPNEFSCIFAKNYEDVVDVNWLAHRIATEFHKDFPNNRDVSVRVFQNDRYIKIRFGNSMRLAPDVLIYDVAHQKIIVFDFLGRVRFSIARQECFYVLINGKWIPSRFSIYQDTYNFYLKIDILPHYFYFDAPFVPIANCLHIRK